MGLERIQITHMKTIALIFLALALPLVAQTPSPQPQYREVLRFSGEDEAKDSPRFTVGNHWRVTVEAASLKPDFQMQVFSVPDAGTHNQQIIDMDKEGRKTVYVRDGGIYRLSIIGFSAHWTVTVEDAK